METLLTGVDLCHMDPRGGSRRYLPVPTASSTHMGFSLRGFSSHEGVGHAVLRTALPVAALVVALELAGAPAVVQRAVAAALLAAFHVVVDHLVEVCPGRDARR